MSTPIFTSRFRWAENRWVRQLGWPIMVAVFILLSLRFQDIGSAHYQLVSFFTKSSVFPDIVMTFFLPMLFCGLFCTDDMGFASINKGPDWSTPTLWYATSAMALIAWIFIAGTFLISMIYWIMGVTFGFKALGIILGQVVPEPKRKPVTLSVKASAHSVSARMMIDTWGSILHGQHIDQWSRFIAEARAAGREDLAQVLQVMLDQDSANVARKNACRDSVTTKGILANEN